MDIADNPFQQIKSNWQRVLAEVTEATEAVGRDPASVRIVGVSKYVDVETTALLIDAGCHDLGENRPQQLWQKAEALVDRSPLRWHMIGHVQTNKVRRMLRHNPLIHSIDSERLLQVIADEAAKQNRTVEGLLEVNISGDENKTGLPADQIGELLLNADPTHVRIRGLMAMAGWGTEAGEAARQFQAVAELRDRLQSETQKSLPELSMGMSGDFREAIAAGATMVRIGSALFEGIRRS
jgi:pyridoxal phosphate enzyme (YggS family)